MNHYQYSVFRNDPFSMVFRAFENLFPGKKCICMWEPDIRPEPDGTPVLGLTHFDEDGDVYVFIGTSLTIVQAIEIFAHELAHVAVGVDHDHDEVWEKAFDDIFNEYNRIGDEMFPPEEKQE